MMSVVKLYTSTEQQEVPKTGRYKYTKKWSRLPKDCKQEPRPMGTYGLGQ